MCKCRKYGNFYFSSLISLMGKNTIKNQENTDNVMIMLQITTSSNKRSPNPASKQMAM
jgi:hypothetical protein